MRLANTLTAAITLLLAAGTGSALAATSPVELRLPNGSVKASAPDQGSFSYPASGSEAYVGSIQLSKAGTRLGNISLFGGRISASSLTVPRQGLSGAAITGLIVDGRRVNGTANKLVMLGGGSYMVVLQEAVAGIRSGLVGLRVHLGQPYADLPVGTDILVGLPVVPAAKVRTSASASVLGVGDSAAANTLLALGVEPLATIAGGGSYVYPLAVHGTLIGCPFARGSTHSPYAWPYNLESDDAVDITALIGTPVLAVAAGTIGSQIGPLDSTSPQLAGMRVHLDTATNRFYYAHLSRIDVVPGEQVVAGQQIGLSGEANGVAHLHFAQDGGNPAQTIGEPSACGAFQQFFESW